MYPKIIIYHCHGWGLEAETVKDNFPEIRYYSFSFIYYTITNFTLKDFYLSLLILSKNYE